MNFYDEKGLDRCYQCDEFPYQEDMLKDICNRAFNRYAKQFGKQALLDRLHVNYKNGITYHKPDGLIGDYDLLETEDDIFRLIAFGSHSPYVKCPTLETKQFKLRLVRMEDAEDLLKCYSDPKSQELFNADKCTGDFCYHTLEEMQDCIDFWLMEYGQQAYVRFAVVDKLLDRAVGTIEMFGMVGQYHTPDGVLRLDLCSEYEKTSFLRELLTLCAKDFFPLFGVEKIITKAVPIAANRIEILSELDFQPVEISGRRHSWELGKE